MIEPKAMIEVYGADIICASCVNAPSSKDTYEWLQAAISRKFPDQEVKYRFINIEEALENERDIDYANRIQEDEFFYPLVLVNDEVVGEGYVQIKPVYEALEKLGYSAK
ncbi:YuzD family protein [Lysinibacillus odysseyi]|uniref:Disulfide oxidoreductase n=1 Tax=Lysinibacillus odysseyi 34hs-1 = NBRC 100172 TaxID=1220589 RepID=A0A0A3J6A3_9BACI|nr:YuzD family protein [Lysinibacillus odysseyi]KGR82597.1 disulfide oxidoreductase [Lysinibacillus odysseyi 34hs-1 = NBRC 100172]